MSAASRSPERSSGGASNTPASGRPTGEERVLLFADSLARKADQAPEEHRLEPWLVVRMGAEKLALPVRQVVEVVRPGSITKVPHAPFPVCGVTNLRGTILAVVDLRLRLGLPALAVGPASRIAVVVSKGRRIGLLVDAAEHVSSLDALRFEPVPEDVLSERSYYLQGVFRRNDELLILLDLDRVLQVRAIDDEASPATEEPER